MGSVWRACWSKFNGFVSCWLQGRMTWRMVWWTLPVLNAQQHRSTNHRGLFGYARKLACTYLEKKSRMHEALNEVYL